MAPHRRATGVSCVVGVVTPALLAAGFALAAGLTVGATYAWAAQDVAWIVSYGTATLLALVLPLAILVLHERRQVERGDISGPAGASTTPIWAWELFATLPGLLACPFILLAAWCAWMFWIDGLPAASVYFAFIALAAIADAVAFLVLHERWRTKNGLQPGGVATTR